MSKRYFDYPFDFDGRGKSADTDRDDHVRDLICQVLFTNPGERVNLPGFGCGIRQLVFAPNSRTEAATATQFLVQGALQRWLGDVIRVNEVRVTSENERLTVHVDYFRLDNGVRQRDRFPAPENVS
jgi:phage baseplate assembly protein W